MKNQKKQAWRSGRRPHRSMRSRKVGLRQKSDQRQNALHNSPVNFMEARSPQEIEVSTEKLLQDLKAVVRDGEELLRAGAENLSERGAAARERLAAAIEVARQTKDRLQERAVQGARVTDRFVRTNPYEAIGIAFGVGMLFGVLINRR
jgi:ElaB/YqjD/DUF883 family membrane-anchored ribosome-binding protein